MMIVKILGILDTSIQAHSPAWEVSDCYGTRAQLFLKHEVLKREASYYFENFGLQNYHD